MVTVSQVGSSNTVFRTSCEYIYQDGTLTKVPGTGSADQEGVSWVVANGEEEE